MWVSHCLFATRNQNDKSTATHPVISGLSEHEPKYLTVNNISPRNKLLYLKERNTEENKERIFQFQLQLTNEFWESLRIGKNTSNNLNSFLCNFLYIFEAVYPVKYKNIQRNKNCWISKGRKTSFVCKIRLIYIHMYV
jgi:hypothetical protein